MGPEELAPGGCHASGTQLDRAAEVYSGLVESSDLDLKMWDFEEIRKDHEQIVGQLEETLARVGQQRAEEKREIWPAVERHPPLRPYEDRRTLEALREGERAELEECKKLISSRKDNPLVHSVLATSVIPILNAHISLINHYLEQTTHRPN